PYTAVGCATLHPRLQRADAPAGLFCSKQPTNVADVVANRSRVCSEAQCAAMAAVGCALLHTPPWVALRSTPGYNVPSLLRSFSQNVADVKANRSRVC